MSTRLHGHAKHQIYPKRYFDVSPTWFQWNKLTATDVHALREERGFESQGIYFHLNHPIHFVRLVGLVVDIEIQGRGKYILLSIDDSSGACIEVKTEFRQVKADDHAEYPSTTVVDNLDVHVHLGETTVLVDKKPIDIGTVIKVKGTIDSFRSVRQLKLERIWVVKDTNEEAKAWAETAKWRQNVLAKPWVLSSAERQKVDDRVRQDEIKERETGAKRKAYDKKHAEKKRRHLEKAEKKRKREEEELDMGALLGSHMLPGRVTDS